MSKKLGVGQFEIGPRFTAWQPASHSHARSRRGQNGKTIPTARFNGLISGKGVKTPLRDFQYVVHAVNGVAMLKQTSDEKLISQASRL